MDRTCNHLLGWFMSGDENSFVHYLDKGNSMRIGNILTNDGELFEVCPYCGKGLVDNDTKRTKHEGRYLVMNDDVIEPNGDKQITLTLDDLADVIRGELTHHSLVDFANENGDCARLLDHLSVGSIESGLEEIERIVDTIVGRIYDNAK